MNDVITYKYDVYMILKTVKYDGETGKYLKISFKTHSVITGHGLVKSQWRPDSQVHLKKIW